MITTLIDELRRGLDNGSDYVAIPHGTTIEEIEEALLCFRELFWKDGDAFLPKLAKTWKGTATQTARGLH